jgi:hypothetical protein
MAINAYPAGGMFGAKLNAYLQGARAKVKHAEVAANGWSNEVQTLALTSFDAEADTIKLTHATVASAAVTAKSANGVTLADFQAKADALFALTIPGYVAGDCVVTETTENVEYVFTFSGGSVAKRDISAITATNGTGSATGVVTETNKGQTGVTAVSGILRDDIILFAYNATENADETVAAVAKDAITIERDGADGDSLVVAWLTRH